MKPLQWPGWRTSGGALLLGALLAAALWTRGMGTVGALAEGLRDAGPAGMAAYALVYVVGAVLLLPGGLLTLLAGALYGPWLGLLIVSPASTAAAVVAFLLGRTLARDAVAHRVARYPLAAAVYQVLGQDAFRAIFLLRLSPLVPYNLLNYALGLSRAPLSTYTLASWLGMLPGTLLYVSLGAAAGDLAPLAAGRVPEAGRWGRVLLAAGLVATAVLALRLTRLARRAFEERLRVETGDGAPGSRAPRGAPGAGHPPPPGSPPMV